MKKLIILFLLIPSLASAVTIYRPRTDIKANTFISISYCSLNVGDYYTMPLKEPQVIKLKAWFTQDTESIFVQPNDYVRVVIEKSDLFTTKLKAQIVSEREFLSERDLNKRCE